MIICGLAGWLPSVSRKKGDRLTVILGIDPGYAIVGYGAVETVGNRFRLLGYGAITTPAGIPLPDRLQEIYEGMGQIIEKYHPNEVAIEELFFSKNITTGIAVGEGRGVILLRCKQAGLPIYEYTPMEVKQAVSGYGNAAKPQVMEMTRRLLGLDKLPRPDDAADALALTICHANRKRTGMSAGLFGNQVK